MKLPDYTRYEPLNQLRALMGAELGQFTPAKNANRLTVEEIDQLARSGIEIPLGQVRTLEDGTLAYKNSRVILYIRDVPQYRNTGIKQTDLPKFHVSDCQKLQEMRANKRFDRYVVATREDGQFEVNIISKGFHSVDRRLEALKVCQFCLGKLNWKGFDHVLPKARRDVMVSGFTLMDFFRIFGKSLVTKEPSHNADTAPLNNYTADFKLIADRVKKDRSYRCDQCKINLEGHRQFLHAHHINGQKSDNHPENIKLVCIRCHANEYNHSHIKALPEYKKFIQLFG